MKANRIILFLVPVAFGVILASIFLRPADVASVEPAMVRVEPVGVARTELLQPLEAPVMPAEPARPVEIARIIEAPVAIQEPKAPVQPVEERGDAMLFEGAALLGTPFDQSIVRPFD